MTTRWMVHTYGDTPGAIRDLLRDLFQNANLDSMLVPLRVGREPARVGPDIVDDAAKMTAADPFAPLMTVNSARLVADFVRENPRKRLGAVMRPCEIRALLEMAENPNP